MTAGIRDILKWKGVVVICACAVLVCTLFWNYNMDMKEIEPLLSGQAGRMLYDALVMTGEVVCGVTGGCLLLTTVVMLMFYIRNHIDAHRKELGILKALGYSSLRIAGGFWVCGFSVLLGTGLGYLGAHLMMQAFYNTQNEDHLLPEVAVHFHPMLFFALVLAPAAAFALLSVGYGYRRLRRPVLELLAGTAGEGRESAYGGSGRRRGRKQSRAAGKIVCRPGKQEEGTFLEDLRRSVLRQRRSLIFFMAFAAFCFGAMVQMSASMKDLSSVMMGAMMLLIGLILAVVTLFIATTTVVKTNGKTIAMMGAFGYTPLECGRAVLGGYRPFAWMGFFLGTLYQYGLLKVMVSVVFSGVAGASGVPEYEFDVPVFVAALAAFAVLYELMMYGYTRKIRRMSVKEVMMDGD